MATDVSSTRCTFADVLAQELRKLEARLAEVHASILRDSQAMEKPASTWRSSIKQLDVAMKGSSSSQEKLQMVPEVSEEVDDCVIAAAVELTVTTRDNGVGSSEGAPPAEEDDVGMLMSVFTSPSLRQFPTESAATGLSSMQSNVEKLNDQEEAWHRFCGGILHLSVMTKTINFDLRQVWENCEMGELREVTAERHTMAQHMHTMNYAAFRASATSVNMMAHNMLHPRSNLRMCWEVLAMLSILYSMVWIPYEICSDRTSEGNSSYYLGVAVFWTVDLFLLVNTGMIVQGRLIQHRTQVLWELCKWQLPFDVVLLTVDWAVAVLSFMGEHGTSRSISAFRLFKLFRAMHIAKFVKERGMMDRLGSMMSSGTSVFYLGAVRNACAFMIGIHIIACLWYSLGSLEEHGWVADRGVSFKEAGRSVSGFHLYLTSLHWALSQVHGSMDLNPTSERERAFAVIFLLVAFLVNTSFVASITNMVLQMENLFYERQKQERLVRTFLAEHHISGILQDRIRRHVQSYHSRKCRQEQEEVVFAHLSGNLVADLFTELRLPLLRKHPFFRRYTDNFERNMAKMCQAFQMQTSVRGDCIFQACDIAVKMYCVFKGELRYIPVASANDVVGSSGARKSEAKKRGASSRSVGGFGGKKPSRRSSRNGRATATGSLSVKKVQSMMAYEDTSSSDDEENCMPVQKGTLVSEATLWMPWIHLGNLSTFRDDTQLMSLEPREFEQLIVSTNDSYRMAVQYAKIFKIAMQRARGTDIIKQEFLEILMASGKMVQSFSGAL